MPDFNSLRDRNESHFVGPRGSVFGGAIARLRSLGADEWPRGVDLSHWNGTPDFVGLKASGIDFVYLKVTEGDKFADPTWPGNWRKALDAGLLVGGYHFHRADKDAVAQGNWFLSNLHSFREATKGIMLPAMLDVETRDGKTNATIISNAGKWLAFVKADGLRKPGLYTSPYLWGNLLSPAPPWSDRYWGWVAHWTAAASPSWPSDWHAELRKFWQYGIYPRHSWVGEVQGVSGEVDCNWFLGTLSELKSIMGEEEPPPPPPTELEKRVAALETQMANLTEIAAMLAEKTLRCDKDIAQLALQIQLIHQQLDVLKARMADLDVLLDKYNKLSKRADVLDVEVSVLEEALRRVKKFYTEL